MYYKNRKCFKRNLLPSARSTAVGTGLNTKRNFDKKIVKEISKITKIPLK